MKTRNLAWLLILLCGCPGGDEGTQSSNPPAPPPPAQGGTSGGGNAVATGATPDGSTPTGNETGGDDQTADNNTDDEASNVPRFAAEGALAAHAVPLSMITADHFAVAKFDATKTRNSPLLNALLPEDANIDEGIEMFAEDQVGPGAGEFFKDVDVMWLAFSPGPGKIEDFMGVVSDSPREVDPVVEEDFGEPDFDTEEFDPAAPCGEDEEFSAEAPEDFGPLDGEGFAEPGFGEPDFGGPDFQPGPPPEMPPLPVHFCIYVKCKSADGINALIDEAPPFDRDAPKIERNGRSYQKSPLGPIWYLAGEKDIFVCTDEKFMRNFVDAAGQLTDAPMIERLQGVDIDAQLVVVADETLGDIATQAAAALEEDLPPQVTMVIRKTAAISLAADLDAEKLIDLQLEGKDPQSAQALNDTAKGLKAMGNIGIGALMGQAQENPGGPPVEMLQFAQKVLNSVAIKTEGTTVALALPRPEGLQETLQVAMAAAQAEAKQMQQMNNGRYLAIAALNIEVATRRFPKNIVKDDEELLSWRVQILPYMEETQLYDQVNRDEAWDSVQNKEVLDIEMPTYTTDSSRDGKHTTWRMIPFEGPRPQATEIIFIDAGKGADVHWAAPDAFEIDPGDPIAAFGEEPEGGYIAVYGDGHVERLSREQLEDNLKARYADAQPTTEPETPEPVVRVWTAAGGAATVKATLVKVEDGNVTLKRADTGKEVTLPVDKLSPEDQEYLQTLNP